MSASVAPRTFADVAELADAAGTHLGFSDWIEVSQDRITAFADATGDHQWIHVDPHRAADGPFGATVAHGFLTLSLLPVLAQQVYAVAGLAMSVNYGLHTVRFPAPVPAGSRVRAGVDLVSVEPVAQGHRATVVVTIEIDGVAKPACVAESLALLVA